MKLVSFLMAMAMAIALFATAVAQAEQRERPYVISFGLNEISDWSTQYPFVDLMKTARPWVGHSSDQWGAWQFEDLLNGGYLDEHGWPTALPDGAKVLETRILTDQPATSKILSGRYHLLFDGEGGLEIAERGRVISKDKGHWIFEYKPGEGSVTISINRIVTGNPIRNIRVIKEDHLGIYEMGQKFNPAWLTRLGAVEAFRFMDWMQTNNSGIVGSNDQPSAGDFSYAWRGVPLSDLIELSNITGIDPWFTIPHMADDALVHEFATRVLAELSPDQIAHVEYSNEVWNFIFEQAHWARQQAEMRWGNIGDGWMQYYGLRSAQVLKIWTDVFGPQSENRLKRIVSVHTGWPELEKSLLYSELAEAELGAVPARFFDAYAITGYVGHELGDPDTLKNALDNAEAEATRSGKEAGLSRVALREYVRANRFDAVNPVAADIVRQGSLKTLTDELWPYHAEAARSAGLELLMYEGGTHAAPIGEAVDDERLSQFLIAFNYSEEMGRVYETLLSAWQELGAGPFNAFVDVAPPSKWGSWGALRHLDDQNPRWDALRGSASRE